MKRKIELKDKPLFTVVTVVYNGVSTLEQTILSVLQQESTRFAFEYIVIDGGSTDGSLDIIKKYENSIDRWVSEPDNGIYDAMNKGIAMARGEYIGMLNSDDYFADQSVLSNVAFYLSNYSVDAVFAALDIVQVDNPDLIVRKYRVSKFSKSLLRMGLMPAHPTFYCRKSCYLKAGEYSTNYKIAADFEMLARLLVKIGVTWRYLDFVAVKMRVGGVSTKNIKSRWILNKEILRACRENNIYTNYFFLALKLPFRIWEMIA